MANISSFPLPLSVSLPPCLPMFLILVLHYVYFLIYFSSSFLFCACLLFASPSSPPHLFLPSCLYFSSCHSLKSLSPSPSLLFPFQIVFFFLLSSHPSFYLSPSFLSCATSALTGRKALRPYYTRNMNTTAEEMEAQSREEE